MYSILDKSQGKTLFFLQVLIHEKWFHLELFFMFQLSFKFFFFFLIFQNQSAAGNVIQVIKKKSLMSQRNTFVTTFALSIGAGIQQSCHYF